jgi:hypothetical protein
MVEAGYTLPQKRLAFLAEDAIEAEIQMEKDAAKDDVGIAAGRETAQSGNTTAMRAGGFLKPSSDAHNVVQESKGVQQVGFTRSVRPHQKNASLADPRLLG